MPAAWSAKDERQYTHILRSCKRRGRYGEKRCKRIAGSTVNKTRRQEGRARGGTGLGFWTPAFAGVGNLEKTLPRHLRRDFCLPGRTKSSSKYPVPDCRHASNALGRAKTALRGGYLTKAQYRRVVSCARRAERKHCR